ncbi:MAG: DUF1592 domain-containing protein [Gammaproteobacteria bacterium]|nr:DUF1592 domain-containing protein [Gammaproteobacteria bacterium]
MTASRTSPTLCVEFLRALGTAVVVGIASPAIADPVTGLDEARGFVRTFCAACHTERTQHVRCLRCHVENGEIKFADLDLADVGAHPEAWEKVVDKLRAGTMPPLDAKRPRAATVDWFRAWLATELDRAAAARPNPGPSPVFRRLNRNEYQNAVRDLLHLEIDASRFLPADDSSHGFDNMAGTLRLSPLLMDRYLAAAKAIVRLAIGDAATFETTTYLVGTETERRARTNDAPLGAEGGTEIRHNFPADGVYELTASLTPVNRPGARRTIPFLVDHRLEMTVDGMQAGTFTVPKPLQEVRDPPKHRARLRVAAGSHAVAARFYKMPLNLVDGILEPLVNERGEGDIAGASGALPRLQSLGIAGPYGGARVGETASRRAIFGCTPSGPDAPAKAGDEETCAGRILDQLAWRGYRGAGPAAERQALHDAYAQARGQGADFEAAIGLAVRRLLVSPHFLYRIERPNPAPEPRPAIGLELASRLSFFLWSSIPDDELLAAATSGRLRTQADIEREVRRMLADPKAWALTANFASQWLELRSLAFHRPTEPASLDYDEALRDALQQETELFFDHVLRHDRPVAELIGADYTFLNKRLADHYEITGIQHADLRRVPLPPGSLRGGLLGQGSLLTITSHPDRTSPVLRGKWVLANLLGTPPRPPPPDVPDLEAGKPGTKAPTLRERLREHRDNPACAACHDAIDPPGFALENFDSIGRYRERDASWNAIDSAAVLPDGTRVHGIVGLKQALVAKPERFATTVAERLLTYALGRGLEPFDAPSVREIVARTADDGFRMQALIVNVAQSYPFRMHGSDADRVASAP